MVSNFSKYGAISAKVRAMYGRRLRQADWDSLNSMRSVSSVASYLKRHPGWAKPMENLPGIGATRRETEAVIRKAVINEYIRLFSFASLDDRGFMLFPVYRFEYETILSKLRSLKSGLKSHAGSPIPDFFKNRSKLDFNSLSLAESWSGILQAVKHTLFYEALLTAQSPHLASLPDYTAVGVLLEGKYYEAINKFVSSRYKGATKDLFVRALGQESDLLNLIHIMRLKRFFPDSSRSLDSVLFPVHYRLRRDFFDRVIAAPDYNSALSLIDGTYYAKFFRDRQFDKIEDYYREKIELFNRRELLSAPPSPYTATAYLTLKEFEVRRLNSAIERAYYTGLNL